MNQPRPIPLRLRTIAPRWRALALTAVLAAFAHPAAAQVLVSLTISQKEFLQYEAIPTVIALENKHDAPVTLDSRRKDTAELSIVVERHGHMAAIQPIRRDPIVKTLTLAPDGCREILRDLSEWFDMTAQGLYFVTAELRWKGLVFESKPVAVNVVRGLDVVSVERSMPGDPTLLRRYNLRYWRRERAEHLFLCIEDANNASSFGTYDLGKVIRYEKPTLDVSGAGRIRVVHQSGRDVFTHSTFQTERDRVAFVDQTFHRADGSPLAPDPKPEDKTETKPETPPDKPATKPRATGDGGPRLAGDRP